VTWNVAARAALRPEPPEPPGVGKVGEGRGRPHSAATGRHAVGAERRATGWSPSPLPAVPAYPIAASPSSDDDGLPETLASLLAAYQRTYGSGVPDPAHNPVFAARPRVGVRHHRARGGVLRERHARWTFIT
jgi:hypothetical protein